MACRSKALHRLFYAAGPARGAGGRPAPGARPQTPRNSRRDLMILKLLTPPRAPRAPFFTEPKQSHELRADRFGHRKGRMLPRRDPW